MFDKFFFFTRKIAQALGSKTPYTQDQMDKFSEDLKNTFNNNLDKALENNPPIIKDIKKKVITLPIIHNYIPINTYSRCGQKKLATRSIVLHYTGSPGSSAESVQYYFSGLARQVNTKIGTTYASSQLTVGLDGEIIQLMPLDEVAYHTGGYLPPVPANTPAYLTYTDKITSYILSYGNPNYSSIGIEMCINSDWKLTEKTITSTAYLTAYLCQIYRLTPESDLYRHGDITYKECPKPWFDDTSLWVSFQKQVQQYYEEFNFAVAS